MTDRLSDAAIRRSVVETIRNVVMPALVDPHARAAAVQLVALCSLAADRSAGDDHLLADAVDSLRANPLAAHVASGDSPRAAASAMLVAAVGDESTAAEQVRAALRPVLIAELDSALSEGDGLMHAFRGRLPDA